MGFLIKLFGFAVVGIIVVALFAIDPKAMSVAFGLALIAILAKLLGR